MKIGGLLLAALIISGCAKKEWDGNLHVPFFEMRDTRALDKMPCGDLRMRYYELLARADAAEEDRQHQMIQEDMDALRRYMVRRDCTLKFGGH